MFTVLLDPAILFFIFGIFAGLIKSNLEIPNQISKFLSLYLLMALGLKGGFALAASGFTLDIVAVIGIGVFMAILVPAISYFLLKNILNGFDSAAVAATYGSVSAVTFVTATQFLSTNGIEYGGFMAAVMALMESPAIIMAIALAAYTRMDNTVRVRNVLHESFTDGANILLLAALVIGMITGVSGEAVMKPFTIDLFKGLLAFFLLDMGIQVARRIPDLKGKNPLLLSYAIIAPITHSMIALGLAALFGVSLGNAILLMVLAASASYIAVPAAVKHAIPEANPSVYVGLSLGLTFPFNVLVGIPLYSYLANIVL
jgi:uncharacterized protein